MRVRVLALESEPVDPRLSRSTDWRRELQSHWRYDAAGHSADSADGRDKRLDLGLGCGEVVQAFVPIRGAEAQQI